MNPRKKRLAAYLKLMESRYPATKGDTTIITPDLPRGKRAVRTWREGEVGVWGTRKVLPGGYIVVTDTPYMCSELKNRVGEIVYFGDADSDHGALDIYTPTWHLNGYVSGEKWIGYGRLLSEFEMIAELAMADAMSIRCETYMKLRGLQDMLDMVKGELSVLQEKYDSRDGSRGDRQGEG